jgi:hypothetical protein
MKKVIIILASLLMVLIAGISMAASTLDSSSDPSYDDRTFDQIMDDMENSTMILDLTIGRKAGRAEMLGQLGLSYSGEDIGDYNGVLKNRCYEPRYNELKLKYPGARPAMPGDLVNEYGDYIGPEASYDSATFFPNETVVMYLVCGLEAGRAEVVGQVLEAEYYGNETEKIDEATVIGILAQCNIAIQDYNVLLKKHCDESTYRRYDELKIEEFRIVEKVNKAPPVVYQGIKNP